MQHVLLPISLVNVKSKRKTLVYAAMIKQAKRSVANLNNTQFLKSN